MAQSLLILLMDEYLFTEKEITLNWVVLDPLIGCWLLDPDHPPTSFQGVMSQLGTTPNYKVTANDTLAKSCDMIVHLSKSMEKLNNLLVDKNLWNVFVNIEMKVLSILSGILLSV